MEVYPIISTGYDSNCYILQGGLTALVDAGMNAGRVLKEAARLNTGIDFLIITHCHYDHVGGVPSVVKEFSPTVMAHELDAASLQDRDKDKILSKLFSAQNPRINVDVRLREGDVIDLDGVRLTVMHTPGHSSGSISLYEQESRSLFTGDVLFADGTGRTDLPGGSPEEMKKSLKRLYDLYLEEGIKTIYPGHGPIGVGRDIEKNYLMSL